MFNNTKMPSFFIKTLVFFLILSADTIRMSADSLIAFQNILIVSMGSLIGRATQQDLQICLLYFGFDFERFSEPQNTNSLDKVLYNYHDPYAADQPAELSLP